MALKLIFFFAFAHASLFILGFTISHYIKAIKKPSLRISLSYVISLGLFGAVGFVAYLFDVNQRLLQITMLASLSFSLFFFVRKKLYKDVVHYRFPIICVLVASILASLMLSLNFSGNYKYIPDPENLPNRNYQTLNVKVLNISHTNANDNYIPYRQAQFMVNNSDPGKDSFIGEWGVHFFQRTPLMGAVAAGYFIALGDKPPIDYSWSVNAEDPSSTYAKFQILSHIVNSLYIIPAFYLLSLLFNRKTATISALILTVNHYFLYNAIFSWPKSLVAFFVLTMWLLLMQKKPSLTVLAGCVGGLAYLTHDLAVFYIAAGALLLLWQRRFRETGLFSLVAVLFAVPWIIASSIIYKKPSTFILYPFSVKGLPQPGQTRQVLQDFINTPVTEIISIRINTILYLITPHDFIYGNGQSLAQRAWAVSIFSIPGSLGLGMIIPTLLGIIRRIQKMHFWILVLTPIVLAALIVGWRGQYIVASLHFAQPVVVLLIGLGCAYMVSKRSRLLLCFALFLNAIHLLFIILYSYNFKTGIWLRDPTSFISVIAVLCIMFGASLLAYKAAFGKPPKILKTSSIF